MPRKAWGLAARKSIIYKVAIPIDILNDVEILLLCEYFHCLPYDIETMDPEWIWKARMVIQFQNERAERESKNGH